MPHEALRYDVTPVGLHYLLIHYDIPEVDPSTFRLSIGGHVETPLQLTLDALRAMPSTTLAVTMECAGNGRALLEPRPTSQPWLLGAVGNAAWTGVPLRDVLAAAGVREDAVEVLFTGRDRGVEGDIEQAYERSLPLEEAMREDVLVAFEMNGSPLLPQHGFPVRLLVPGWYGMTSVKWLERVTVRTDPFEGYQMTTSYRMRNDPDEAGEPVTRIRPRALMAPPGIPEFATRGRVAEPGTHRLQGRAWSGLGRIERVEVSTDDGAAWADAVLGPEPASAFGWRAWAFDWRAEPGEHVLCCRATDATGVSQPLEAEWNVGGYRNTAVQRVPVLVRG
ncbi:MAG TPA: sulfite oxidase [Actinomycetota bacterium]|nr:sulfite oxidase [Actinomycetota bacterium]